MPLVYTSSAIRARAHTHTPTHAHTRCPASAWPTLEYCNRQWRMDIAICCHKIKLGTFIEILALHLVISTVVPSCAAGLLTLAWPWIVISNPARREDVWTYFSWAEKSFEVLRWADPPSKQLCRWCEEESYCSTKKNPAYTIQVFVIMAYEIKPARI
jgi:hypothetical protein